MTLLEKKQEEYIEFLAEHLTNAEILQRNRGIYPSQETLDKGIQLRKEIETLKNNQDLSQNNYVPFVTEVETFNATMGKPNNYTPNIPDEKEWKFVYNFVLEELEEYREACEKGDIVGVLDALADLTYVATGNGVMLHGLRDKIWSAYQEVQASNMSKACKTEKEAEWTVNVRTEEQGEPCHYEKVGDLYIVYRSRDRKVMKNVNYFKPDLVQFFTNEELQNCYKSDSII